MSEKRPAAKKPGAQPPIGKWIGFGVGASIGSAAIAAALLYATRTKRPPEKG